MRSLLELEQVSVNYGERRVLDNISFSIDAGEIVTLIGPNGAGKTTLIKAILGLAPLADGRVVRHNPLKIGYMPQKLQLDATLPLTVKRFLALIKGPVTALEETVTLCGIAHLLTSQVRTLSGGELQRVMLARALLLNPDLLLLDEPAQGVDISGQTEMYELIGKARDKTGCGVFMISHDLHLVMASTDKVICLNRHVCCSGHPEQVSNDPAYRELFGDKTAASLAIYHHHHNHHHNLHGDVIGTNANHEGCDHG